MFAFLVGYLVLVKKKQEPGPMSWNYIYDKDIEDNTS